MWTTTILSVAVALTPCLGQGDEPVQVPSADANLFFAKQPIAPEGVMLVPLDAVETWLATKATRSGDTVTISHYGETNSEIDLRFDIGNDTGKVNGADVPLGAKPRAVDNVVYVPLRFVAEAVGVWVDSEDHRIHLRKPDLNWECWIQIPPHPQSLEGKMVALAVAQNPAKPKRLERIELAGDTMSGAVTLAMPGDEKGKVIRQRLDFTRDRTGWHLTGTTDVAPPESTQE
jgi:Copper amine oxidase N-terminal domain